MSDCEVHNEPAFPKGYCTCRRDSWYWAADADTCADMLSYKKGFLAARIKDALADLRDGFYTEENTISYIVEYALGDEIERDIAP